MNPIYLDSKNGWAAQNSDKNTQKTKMEKNNK